jgi:DNA polymerase III subunit epsilon
MNNPNYDEKRLVVVDVETTGLSAARGGRVIEVGAVMLENGIVAAELDTLIRVDASISYGAFRVHGITGEMLAGKPIPSEVWPLFMEFIGGSPLIAHNAPFDSAFIRNELAQLGISLANRWHCTVRKSRRLLPQLPNHRLDTVYRHLFGAIPTGMRRHRALDDARLAAAIWLALEGR